MVHSNPRQCILSSSLVTNRRISTFTLHQSFRDPARGCQPKQDKSKHPKSLQHQAASCFQGTHKYLLLATLLQPKYDDPRNTSEDGQGWRDEGGVRDGNCGYVDLAVSIRMKHHLQLDLEYFNQDILANLKK